MTVSKASLLVILAASLCACHSGSSSTSPNLEPLQPLAGVSDWTNAGGSPTHSGYVPVTLDATKFSLRWSVAVPKGNTDLCDNAGGFGDCVFIYQAVTDSADEHVVVLTDSGFGSANIESHGYTLTALDEGDGSVAWSSHFGLSGDPEFSPVFDSAPPSVFDGKVYFSFGESEFEEDGNTLDESPFFQALDAKTGAKLFSAKPPSVNFTQSVVSDSTLYRGEPLSAFDAATGAARWTSAGTGSDPSVAPGAVYVAGKGALTAFDPASGSQLYQIAGVSAVGFATAPMLDGRGGAVVGLLGSAFKFSNTLTPAKGVLEHFSLSNRVMDWKVAGDFSTVMRPVVARGVVYACDGSTMNAYSVSDGTRLWSWTGDSSLQDDGSGKSNCSLLATDDLLFVSSDQTTSALDLNTHTPVWSWPEGGKLSLSPTGLLYISVADPAPTHLVAINLR
jgi:putative pyrroloquinoline-quinone binding quinoprotein